MTEDTLDIAFVVAALPARATTASRCAGPLWRAERPSGYGSSRGDRRETLCAAAPGQKRTP